MSARRHNSNARSEAAARTVTSVHTKWPELPRLGECVIVRASVGYHATFNAGPPFYCCTAFGPTPEEAMRRARAQAEPRHVCTTEGCGAYPCSKPEACTFPKDFPCPKHFIAEQTGEPVAREEAQP